MRGNPFCAIFLYLMKRILFPTDFSEHSGNALVFASAFAELSDAEIILFHTIVPVVGSITQMGYTVELNSVLYDLASESLENIAKTLQNKGISTQTTLRNGYVTNEVEAAIEEFSINMIIMGSHGKSNLIDKLVGSTAAHVMMNIDIPSVIVPSKYNNRPIRRAAFAHQLVQPSIKHLDMALNFTKILGVPQLEVVHIYSNEQDVYEADKTIINQIDSIFSDERIHYHFINNDSVVEGLSLFLKENNIDLLITSSNKKTFWRRLMLGNISAKMAMEIDTPILILKG